MRVIKIPGDVEIEKPSLDGQTVTFTKQKRSLVQFLGDCFKGYEMFSKGHVNALLYAKLVQILKSTDLEKGEIWFEDEDFKKVEAAVSGATWVTADINMAYIPFYEAVKNARTEVLATDKKS